LGETGALCRVVIARGEPITRLWMPRVAAVGLDRSGEAGQVWTELLRSRTF